MLNRYNPIQEDGYIKKTDSQKALKEKHIRVDFAKLEESNIEQPAENQKFKEKFELKFELLKKTWPVDKDNEPARIIAPILYLSVKPIYFIIIEDNKEKFTNNKDYTNARNEGAENNNYLDLYNWLEVACLSGSEEIAKCLLSKLKKNYMDYDYLLGYVATSPNFEWAKEIATILKTNGRRIPSAVYSYVEDLDRIDAIEKIFSLTKSNQPKIASLLLHK